MTRKGYLLFMPLLACGGSDLATMSSAVKPGYELHTTDDSGVEWIDTFPLSSTYSIFFAVDTPPSAKGSAEVLVRYGSTPWQRFDFTATRNTRVWVSMPVLGTSIQTRGYVGAWSATVYVGASPVVVKGFTVTP